MTTERTTRMTRTTLGSLLAAMMLVGACTGHDTDSPTSGGDESGGDDTGSGSADEGDTGSGSDEGSGSALDEWQERLAARTYNYPTALRTAALRLTGELPTVEQVRQLASATDQKTAYAQLVGAMLTDARFQRQMLAYWRDTFKMGGTAELDAAPAFATYVTVNNLSSDQLLTATTGTCPTIGTTGTITLANCTNNPPVTAGVLTNPGALKHYVGNLAFRRARWVQEVFDCTAFPAEVQAPTKVGTNDAAYTAPWPFASISGTDNGGRINFHDTSAVVCANCHATMNHVAPLFANFDMNGLYTTAISVTLPTDGRPLAVRTDWLPANEPTAWRYQKPAADLGALGKVMSEDPRVAACTVARAWNFALGKGDIVQTLSVVPPEVIASEVDAFNANGRKLRDLFLRVFTSDDFTKY